ncbi:MAG: type II toxin-antitoxin system HicB family antitoxin [Patescibacteria group bacterium]|nr:type II toxin-antitoxin system HicB family antitoxin [Patescibacteria group bacterium]
MKPEKLQYNVIFRPEPEGGYTVMVPALPGCITYGHNLKEARKMAANAIQGYLLSLKKHKEPIPSDDETFIGSVRLSLNKTLVCA